MKTLTDIDCFTMPHLQLTFSFANTSDEASGGTAGQIDGLGQGSMLSEALVIRSQVKKIEIHENVGC